MNWQVLHPEALLFLVLAPLVLILHLARRRPTSFRIPFLKIWERAQPHRGGGFKRLQDLLALLIALSLIVLLTSAILRPFSPAPEPEHALIVLDDSASMSASEGDGQTRFEKAKARLTASVRASPPHVRFALASLAPDPVLLAPFSAGREAVLEALEKAAWKPVSADTFSGVRDFAPLVAGKESPRIWLASDRPFSEIPERVGDGVPLEYLPVGTRPDNVRVVSFSGAWGGWWDSEASFFLKVENTGPTPASVSLVVHGGGESFFRKALTLEAGGGFETTFPIARKKKEIFLVAELTPGGALSLDDRAWCRLPGRVKHKILLVSESPSAFVQSAIQGLEEMMIKEGSGVVAPREWDKAVSSTDMVVFEGWGPGDSFPEGGALVIGSPPSRLPGPVPGPVVESASVVEWDRKHPVTQGLSFDNVFFHKSAPLPPEYHPLVVTDRGAVVGTREDRGGRAVVLSFALKETNLGLLSSFPILVRNAIRWVGAGTIPGSCPGLEPGCRKLPAGYGVEWTAGRPGGPGVAALTRDGRRFRVAVNFDDPEESTLAAPAAVGGRGLTVQKEKPPGVDPWRAFLWVALALIALDWLLVFFRRG